jgi:hypothetical protein
MKLNNNQIVLAITKVLPDCSILYQNNTNYYTYFEDIEAFQNSEDFSIQEFNEDFGEFLYRTIVKLIIEANQVSEQMKADGVTDSWDYAFEQRVEINASLFIPDVDFSKSVPVAVSC